MLSRNDPFSEVGFFKNKLLLGPETQPKPADAMVEAATAVKKRRLTCMSWFIQKRIELEGTYGARML